MIEDRIKQQASLLKATVVLPDSSDPRVIEAATILSSEQLATPVLVDASTSVDSQALIDHLLTQRGSKGLTKERAEELSCDPLYKAAWLVRSGKATVGVAGSLSTTSDVLRAGIWTIGPEPSTSVVSSFFLMSFPNGSVWTYADCGVVPDPTSEQLADIAWSASRNHILLTQTEARVAFLSFSTKGSAVHQSTDKVRRAYTIFHSAHPEVIADGELQADAAIVPMVAHRKAPLSPVAGMANVLIFPDLNSGNIAYKLTERLGGAHAYGPIVQGLAKPFVDLSRGCSVHDIVMAACIAIVMSTEKNNESSSIVRSWGECP